ncbi:MAG: MBOAT family O-acyltransferase [Intestinimonas sp.]
MVFSSLLFLFLYLPVVLLIYYVTPLRWRNGVLLVFNLIFYGWGEPVYIVIMFLSTVIDYTHGILVGRCKRRGDDRGVRLAVCSSVVFNLALLFFFKYWDFVAGSLAAIGLPLMPILGLSLPIGISFYTFQTMSYTIDVYRGDAPVQRNLINFGTFVTLFPQLIAGPIIKYKELGDQIDHRDYPVERFASGIQTFAVGLGKKVLLANNLGQLWDAYKALPAAELTTAGAWLGVIAFSLQIYFDFSGYSDMAVGLGRMLGFEFTRNFDYPYISRSVTEFWRRWHISLGSWFREYVYIPMGATGCPGPGCASICWWCGRHRHLARRELEFPAVGALLRRAAHCGKAVAGAAHRAVARPAPARLRPVPGGGELGHLRRGGLLSAGALSGAMFGFAGGGAFDGAFFYYLRSYLPTLVLACAASTPLAAGLWRRLPERVWKAALPVLLLCVLLLSTAYLVDATYNPFLYFRF